MSTFVLDSANSEYPLKALISRLGAGDIQICDDSGEVLAYLTSPDRHEDELYSQAIAVALAEKDLLRRRAEHRGGLTTEQLCRRVGMEYHGDRLVK